MFDVAGGVRTAPAPTGPRAVSALSWQPSLLDGLPRPDLSFDLSRRVSLDAHSWVDHVPGWLTAPDPLFQQLLQSASWTAHQRLIFDVWRDEPRLTARWADGEVPRPLIHLRASLSRRYDISFDSIGVNLYRDGHDGVAWHRDRVHRILVEPLVATVSLGAPRRFLLRPRGGGRSVAFLPRAGDLLVMGGRCQQDWEHTVPKCADAGPRMAITLRHTRPPRVAAVGGGR